MKLKSISMWNQYLLPGCKSEAVHLLKELGSNARVVAGGTDLVMALQEGKASPVETIVDISRIPELQEINLIETGDGKVVEIGSCVTLSNLIQSDLIREYLPLLAVAAHQIAGPQVRNLATIGGNIVNASPAADMAPALLVYDAGVRIIGPDGNFREAPLTSFFKGYRKVDLELSELLHSFYMNVPGSETRHSFRKVQPRRSMAIATLNLAILLRVEMNMIEDIRIAMGAVAPTPVRLRQMELALAHQPVETAMNKEVFFKINQDIEPITDFRASRGYRLHVAQNLLQEQMLAILGLPPS